MAVPNSNRPWCDLHPPLSKSCLHHLQRLNFPTMTPVQCATIPYFMQNKDVAVEAVTGSGKTLAFVIPIVEILTKRAKPWNKSEIGALVITPTRELATQIASVFESFLPTRLTHVLTGGRAPQMDIDHINSEGSLVVVATPGRLVDLLERLNCNLASAMKSLEFLVLDEADRLLELGFEKSITTILSYLPKQRRTGLFSATLSQDVKALIRAGMRNPVTITVKDKLNLADLTPTPKTLSNYFVVCSAEDKLVQLLAILNKFEDYKIIVFFATCASVSYFSDIVKRLVPSISVLALHGRVMHAKRQKLFEDFSLATNAVLMCTDVMARGVDFPAVDWVVQFDPPSSAKVFVHRCGRTARMGKDGCALVMLLPSEVTYVEFLELNQQIVLEPFPDNLNVCGEYVSRVREMSVSERELYEKGKRAFVSFVHFYYKHESRLIFQAKELDLVSLAKGFALPHLPKMPELRADIPYKNKSREKQRREKSTATSTKERRHDKKQTRPKWKQKQEAIKVKVKRGKKRRKEDILSEGELEELAKEARLLKKFKAGKITKQEMEDSIDAL